jgi:glycosyltransferase involved in cell wall biosynthesis
MRISLAIASMNLGGSQYAMAWLAGELAERGHAVQLCTFDAPGSASFFPVSPRVRLENLGLAGNSSGLFQAVHANFRRIRGVRRAVLAFHPDVVLSFIDQMNVLCLLALAGRLPVVVSERIDPARHDIGRLWDLLRLLTYGRTKAIVVQTRAAVEFFPPRLQRLCRVIPNAVLSVVPRSGGAPLGRRLPSPCVVGLGRLHPQKGFDLLLQAFAKTRAAHPDWSLRIFGEGPQRPELEALCTRLGLDPDAVFPGTETDVDVLLAQAEVFVMSSRFEGFPNALCQAMAHGAAVIATNCPSGPDSIVRHGIDGLLVPPEDTAALASALETCMADAGKRAALGARGREIMDRFRPDKVLAMWEQTLHAAVSTPRRNPNSKEDGHDAR